MDLYVRYSSPNLRFEAHRDPAKRGTKRKRDRWESEDENKAPEHHAPIGSGNEFTNPRYCRKIGERPSVSYSVLNFTDSAAVAPNLYERDRHQVYPLFLSELGNAT